MSIVTVGSCISSILCCVSKCCLRSVKVGKSAEPNDPTYPTLIVRNYVLAF